MIINENLSGVKKHAGNLMNNSKFLDPAIFRKIYEPVFVQFKTIIFNLKHWDWVS